MNQSEKNALDRYLLAMADDELILGHRNSEWCGNAPILEEDIAFANIALDEIGHAAAWYSLIAELNGEDPQEYPDRLVYFREFPEFRSSRLVELPNGDWAFSMLRQYFFDAYEMVKLPELEKSAYPGVAAAAAKIRKEELYHLRHTRAWVNRLGLGTGESLRRLQNAFNDLWPYALELFLPIEEESLIVSAGFGPSSKSLEAAWRERVLPLLVEAGISVEQVGSQRTEPGLDGGREGHTSHLKILVSELQSVARTEPEAKW